MHRSFLQVFHVMVLFVGVCTGCDGGNGQTTPGSEDVSSREIAEDLGGADDSSSDGREVVTPPRWSEVCGYPGHSWLPASEVGAPVSWDEGLMTDLTPDDVDALLAGTDFEPLGPARNGVRNFALRYTTQDRGAAMEATAMVGVPSDLDPSEGPLPIVVWLHGTSGFMDDCAPSKDTIGGATATTIFGSIGYITVSPDYINMKGFGSPSPEGSIHHYLVGEQMAIGSLDAIRAALVAIEDAGFVQGDPKRIVLLGGSQGGHACFFTELYAPHYAPELSVVAVGAAVPATDLQRHAMLGATALLPVSANIAVALASFQDWYGDTADLASVLTDDAPEAIASSIKGWMAESCDLPDFVTIPTNLEALFTDAYTAALSSGAWNEIEPWSCYLSENSVPTSSVPRISDTPFMVTYGEMDPLILPAVEKENIPSLCEAGYRLTYVECAGKGHSDGAWAALPAIVRWAEDRLAGVPLDEEGLCVITPPVDCAAE